MEPVPGADQEALRAYRQEKLRLAECLLSLLHAAEGRGDGRRVERLRELAARLAEDRFQLAVVGQFSRGKSTLMNAILGGAYLPTGALPMTSVITSVTYGSRARVTIRRRGGQLPMETSLDDLSRFVAQASQEREEVRVASASIELPAEILRLGFSFVDTPGVGSSVVTNSETTRDFLPQADAVVFVTSFDSPLTEAELSFLHDVRHQVKRIFVVLNKRDLVEQTEASEVEGFVLERLREAGVEDVNFFSLSARDGLTAKCQGDPSMLVASGLREFEAALIDYLTAEKTKEFLLRIGEQAQHFVIALRAETVLASKFDRDPAERARAEHVLQATMTQLDGRRQELLKTLQGSVSGRVAQLPVPGWADKLAGRIVSGVEPDVSPGRSIDLRAEARRLEARSGDAVLEWCTETMSSWCRAVERASESQLIALRRLPDDLERETAKQLDAPIITERGGQERDHPRPEANLTSWTLPPPRSHLAWSRSRAEAVLRQAVTAAAERQVEQVSERLRTALDEWLAALRSWSAAELRERGDAVRSRVLRLPDPALAGELDTLEDSLMASRSRVEAWTMPAGAGQQRPVPPSPDRAETQPPTGCVVCNGMLKALFAFMAHYQFDLATRLGQRTIHAAQKGFCPKHTWYYAGIASPVGISGSYARLAETTAAGLRRAIAESDGPAAWRAALQLAQSSGGDCPACIRLEQVCGELLADLRRRLERSDADPPVVPGLCVDHAAKLLEVDLDREVARRVVSALAGRLERRAEDMRTYSLKRESRRRGLVDKEEEAAYQDVLVWLAGHPVLVGMQANKDDEISMVTPTTHQ